MHSRAGRIRKPSLIDVRYKFEQETDVTDISYSGVGLFKAPLRGLPSEGSVLEGTLQFPDTEFKVPVKVVCYHAQVIGCCYVERPDSLKSYLKSQYKPELAALGLKKVDNSKLKSQIDGSPHWYFDGYDCELFYIVKAGELVRYRVAFLGRYFEGKPGKPPRYATYKADVHEGLRMPGSKIVHDRSNISSNDIENVIKFLTHVENFDDEYKKQVLASLLMLPLIKN